MIPKRVNILWWQGFNKLPERFVPNVKSIIEKNPGYQIYLWDEQSVRRELSKLDPKYLAKIDSFELLHQKVDLSRIILLGMHGGIFTDVDVRAIKGFDSVPGIDTESFIVSYNASNYVENIVKTGNGVSLNNATILVSKNNPVLHGLIEHIMGLSCSVDMSKETCVQATTGPKEFSSYLNQYKDQIKILPNVYLEPCGNDPFCEVKPETVLDHRHEGSWVRDSHKQFAQAWYWMKAHWIWIVGIIGLIILVSASRKTQTS